MNKVELKKVIKSDLYRHYGSASFKTFLRVLTIPGFRFVYILRRTSNYKKLSLPGIYYRFLMRRMRIKYGFQISPETKIGHGFFIGHFGTIVINRKAVIGNNCNIAHGVTIGETFGDKRAGVPTIGDRVWIGTGAVMVGKIIIGSDVMIAPNAFVNIDVPSGHIAIGNPAVLIKKENPTKEYIKNILEE